MWCCCRCGGCGHPVHEVRVRSSELSRVGLRRASCERVAFSGDVCSLFVPEVLLMTMMVTARRGCGLRLREKEGVCRWLLCVWPPEWW